MKTGKVLNRITVREIRQSFGRFFAIFAIIALGSGFFSGLRISSPIFVDTMDGFYRDAAFSDYRLISTVGWDEKSLDELRKRDDVRAAEGARQYDVLVENKSGDMLVYKVHSLTKELNHVRLVKGRMPERSGECLMDASNARGYKIGDKVRFSEENDDDTLDAFKHDTFTITGLADSPLYINFERGTTSIGSGSVAGFVFVPQKAFTGRTYTEAYVSLEHNMPIFSDEYKEFMDSRRDDWEKAVQKAADDRQERLIKKAQDKLDRQKEKVEGRKADGKQELADSRQELKEAEENLGQGKQKLDQSAAQLNAAREKLNTSRTQLDQAYKELSQGKKTLDAQKKKLDAARAQLSQAKKTLDGAKSALDDGEAEIARQEAQIDAAAQAGAISKEEEAAARAQIAAAKEQLAGKRSTYESGLAEYQKNKKQYDAGAAQYREGAAQYEKALAEYESGLDEYESGLAQYESGVAQYEKGQAEYAEGREQYEDGVSKYREGEKTLNQKISDAEKKLEDAQADIDEMESPDTFVLERNTNIGYACFESDSQIVRQVAAVFPFFFILVAALVCITTMTRMVEEQRGQIGVLGGLGYGKRDVMKGFMVYSGTAAVLGCVIGYVTGILLFPTVIWKAYRLMYITVPLRFSPGPVLFAGSLAASLVCSLGTAWLACRSAMYESVASLMRPRAPKIGKRIFLEYIPAVWNRMKFMHKVSVRNIFRYKKRLFMMILGIGGCMALLLTGFGLKDSIAGFAHIQFDGIQVADAEVTFRHGKGDQVPREITDEIEELGCSSMPFVRDSWDLLAGSRVKSVDVIAPYDQGDMDDYFILREDGGGRASGAADSGGETLSLPGKGEALISVSLAKRYGVKKGSRITLRNENMETMKVRVSGIFENHVYNYVVISPQTLKGAVGSANANSLYVNFPEGADAYEQQAALAGCEDVSAITLFKELRDRLANMMNALNYIVLLVILSAAGLAFVVLYNLTNINIIERIREIATIKVLGFYKRETADYILRENLLLTLMGAAAGVVLGIGLHAFVMSKIEVDMVYFPVRIAPLSYLLSVVLTFAFTAFVNVVMSARMEKINMAESLKSVE